MLLPLAISTTTLSSLATGAGTLVLAIATFAAVRSSNRSARIAELALQEQRRPIFAQSRPDDPAQKIMFVDRRWVHAAGGHGAAVHDGGVYLAMSLRNVGAGIGVCQGWHVAPRLQTSRTAHAREDEFRLQTRDLYIPAGDVGMWQGALRDRNDPTYQAVAEAIDNQEVVTIELLYSDQVGDQRTISRFALFPYETRDDEGNVTVRWFASLNRHWYLDRAGPRSDEEVAAATDVVFREREAEDEAARAEAQLAEEARAAEEAEENRAERTPAEQNGDTRSEPETPEPVSVIPRPNCE